MINNLENYNDPNYINTEEYSQNDHLNIVFEPSSPVNIIKKKKRGSTVKETAE